MAARRRCVPRGAYSNALADIKTKLEAQDDSNAQLLQKLHKLNMASKAHELKKASVTRPMELGSAGPRRRSDIHRHGVRAHQHDSCWGVRNGAREQCGGDITHCAGGFYDESRE